MFQLNTCNRNLTLITHLVVYSHDYQEVSNMTWRCGMEELHLPSREGLKRLCHWLHYGIYIGSCLTHTILANYNTHCITNFYMTYVDLLVLVYVVVITEIVLLCYPLSHYIHIYWGLLTKNLTGLIFCESTIGHPLHCGYWGFWSKTSWFLIMPSSPQIYERILMRFQSVEIYIVFHDTA